MEGIELGGLALTAIVAAVSVLAVGLGVALVVKFLVTRAFSGPDSAPGAAQLVARFVQLLIVVASLVYALNTLGVRISPLLGALGIGGIAVALAVQSVLSNAIASVILQIRRPFRRGDQIGTNGLEGFVEEVNLRTVRIRTFDGNDVMIPTSKVLDEPITNYTRSPSRRTELAVGVDYDTDLEHAQRVLREAASAVEGVLPAPAVEAWVTEFGDNAITIALRWWHAPTNAALWSVRSDVSVAVKQAFDREGLVIAFPQRVLHLAPAAERAVARLDAPGVEG